LNFPQTHGFHSTFKLPFPVLLLGGTGTSTGTGTGTGNTGTGTSTTGSAVQLGPLVLHFVGGQIHPSTPQRANMSAWAPQLRAA
jgi:hypothetical protein